MSQYLQAASSSFFKCIDKIPFSQSDARGIAAIGFTGLTGAATGRLWMGAAFTLPAGAICAYAAIISLIAIAKLGALSEGRKFLGFTVLPITTTLLISSAVGVPLTMALLLSVQNTFSIAISLYTAWYILC